MLVPAVQTLVSIAIQDAGFTLYLSHQNGMYKVYTTEGRDNYSLYHYPTEMITDISYNGNYTLNSHSVNLVGYSGTVTPPPWLQKWLSPIHPINTEELQVCYDFSSERLSLKIVVGLISLLFLASHGTKIRTAVKTIGEDLLQSKFTRRLSRPRGSVPGSQTTYSPIEKEGRDCLSESPETIHKASTV